MLHHSRKDGRTALAAAGPTAILLAAVFALACEQATTGPPEQATVVEPAAISASMTAGPGINKDLAALRRGTARFHNFDKAVAAGYVDLGFPCIPGQGLHYGKVPLIDGTLSEGEPEVLMYEPKAGGGMRLVGVEYVVPTSIAATPPSLFGQDLAENTDLGLWFLHVWPWRNNPSDMFGDDNPKVSCEHA